MLSHTPDTDDISAAAAVLAVADQHPGARVRARLRGPDGRGLPWHDWRGLERPGTATGDAPDVAEWAAVVAEHWPSGGALRIEALHDDTGRPYPGGRTWRPPAPQEPPMPRPIASPPPATELRPPPDDEAQLLRAAVPAAGGDALALALAMLDRSAREQSEARAAVLAALQAQAAMVAEWRAHADKLSGALVESVRAGQTGGAALYREAVQAQTEAVRLRAEGLAALAAGGSGGDDEGIQEQIGQLLEMLGPVLAPILAAKMGGGGAAPPPTPA